MRQREEKTVLFLCTSNYCRSRLAEILFNSVASKMGLTWRASSRGLALEPGVNVGPMAAAAIDALNRRGVYTSEDCARHPMLVTTDELRRADRIVALNEAEHLPLLQERFPAWVEKVEFWHIDDGPQTLTLIERAVLDLTARLTGAKEAAGSIAREAATVRGSAKRLP